MTREPLTPYRTIDEVADLVSGYRPPTSNSRPTFRPRKKIGRVGAKNADIIECRKLLRRAFGLIRNNPTEITLKRKIVEAMGGRTGVTDELLSEVEIAIQRFSS